MSRALPLVILSALCGLGSLFLLMRSSHAGARLLAIGAVASVVLGWGVAQYPYILPTSMKLSAAAAPDATLWSVVIVFVIAALVILPSLGLLYYLDQRDLLAAPTVEPGLADDE
jgi:cytochrome d ubiquinol oxidase subunit II